MTVHFNEVSVIKTLSQGQVTSIFKAVWSMKDRGNQVVATKFTTLNSSQHVTEKVSDFGVGWGSLVCLEEN